MGLDLDMVGGGVPLLAHTLGYAFSHRDADPTALLLHPPMGIDARLAARQIEGYRTARRKWPTLYDDADWLFPPRLNCEQASGEAAACYKAALVGEGESMADLTGGMGVDTLHLGRGFAEVHYVEQQEALAQLAKHNLGRYLAGVRVHCTDGLAWLAEQRQVFDLLYIDPARRDGVGRRVYAFEECTPDILAHLPLLRGHCRRLLVKASPMVDIRLALQQLGEVAECHVVAVGGECKEVLFVVEGEGGNPQKEQVGEGRTRLCAVNITPTRTYTNNLDLAAEADTPLLLAEGVGHYLYDPHAALMKCGCFRQIGQYYGLPMLDAMTHLYSSDRLVADFAGRIFEVVAEVSPTRKGVRGHFADGRANIVCRNYPATPEQLRKQTALRDGGTLFLIAATLGGRRTAFVCRSVRD